MTPMPDLHKQFSKAAEKILSNKKPIRKCVYRDHLSDINPDDLPKEIQPIFDAFINRLTSVKPPGDIGVDEAGYLAKDILYIADVLKENRSPS
jgi:hypothetical protein